MTEVNKVSTRYEFFLSGYAYGVVLILNVVALDAEFYALSNGVIFNGCHRVKIGDFSQNTRYKSSFHEYLLSVFA